MTPLATLLKTHTRAGRVDWIGLRPTRRAAMTPVTAAVIADAGIKGDHGRAGKRAVTLIQAEHLPVIAALSACNNITPDMLRRNIVVSGINLTALRNHPVEIGGAVLQISTQCAPCSRIEAALGKGGYNAMRGHGGWCAEVLSSGPVAIGDPIHPSSC